MSQMAAPGAPRLDGGGPGEPSPRPRETPGSAPLPSLLRDLGTSKDGLGRREAERRLSIYGPNTLPAAATRSVLGLLAVQLVQPFALLLWLAAAMAVLTETLLLSLAVVGVILVNAILTVVQERGAARAVSALAAYLPAVAEVIRDGTLQSVPASQLVPGDVLLITEGDRVSADARLVSGAVQMDLSPLTGESVPAMRSADDASPVERLVDEPDVVFSGTACVSGQARAVVFATGAHSEIGRIAALAGRQKKNDESPLERQIRRVTWLIAAVAVGIAAVFLPLAMLAGLSLPESGIFAIGLLVANVPEGLLPTITLALAVGVKVLGRSGALVTRLSSVETLGSTTVICTDKTGTITANQMTATELWADGRSVRLSAGAPVPAGMAEVMADCNQLELTTDPMEKALIEAARRAGAAPRPSAAVFAFDALRKRMSVVVAEGPAFSCEMKGAPEQVLPLCRTVQAGGGARRLTEADAAAIEGAVAELGARGLRVLGLARRTMTAVPASVEEAETDLTFLGLVALIDPPRPQVAAAVEASHSAGIRIHMVTGDNGATALEIARQVGIVPTRLVSGAELDSMSEQQLDAVLSAPGEVVFARSTPDGKLRIAEALRDLGHVVAMTGDGVNDAPALHAADIGVAMGRSGTDVARAAATMILADDDFSTIVTAVREGRRVYDNIRKFVLYTFVHLVPEVVPFAVFALTGGLVPVPLTAFQILAIDLGTEVLPALALGRERAEPDIMARPPRQRNEQLITGRLLVRAWLVMGLVSAVLSMGAFFLVLLSAGWTLGAPTGEGTPLAEAYRQATTTTFAAIVACQIGSAIAARTERASLRSIGFWTNRPLIASVLAAVLFTAALCYLPPLQQAFGTAALPGWVLLLLLSFPPIVWGADELFRAAERLHLRRTHGEHPRVLVAPQSSPVVLGSR
ncbi:MAG: cation transport ATPase [Naasia sp.]|uniref:cation-translocating P-type ATPase n=1 Tax=Naasia sp. TaxID=2546198 RepID=UPI002639473D|nr:cation-transporting P-type ATPase [Naasia sp.]MCU1570489.1 cation transport ATPase [Naasia sp.]